MLTFVEFQMMSKIGSNYCHLQYTPSLAAGQLIAACREAGIKTGLVQGQPRYLGDIFGRDRDRLLQVVSSITEEQLVSMKKEGRRHVGLLRNLAKDENRFKGTLANCRLAASGKIEELYLNNKAVVDLVRIKNGIFEIYDHFRRQGHDVLGLSDRLAGSIKAQKPDMLAVSAMDASDMVVDAVGQVKTEMDIPVIVGGSISRMIGVNDITRYALENFKADYFVMEDGLEALPKLVYGIEKGDISGVPNLAYVEDGHAVRTRRVPYMDFDDIPLPDFSDFDLDGYFFPDRLMPMGISSVCYWKKCAFCGELPEDKRYAKLSDSRFVEIVRHYRDNYRARHIEIQSTCSSPFQIKGYMDCLAREGIDDVNFSIMCRFEKPFLRKEFAESFRKGGIRYVMLGLESGCQHTLDRMRKGTKVEDMSGILRNFHQAGISNLCYVMAGFPGETKEHFMQTVEFLEKNHEAIAGTIVTPFNLFKNSYIAANPQEFGIREMADSPVNPTTLSFKADDTADSHELITLLKGMVGSGRIKIQNDRFEPVIDQWFLDDITGHESLHHILFYRTVKGIR